MIWNRCSQCGRFIGLKEFGHGTIRELVTPDSYLSSEEYHNLCTKCTIASLQADKLKSQEQIGKLVDERDDYRRQVDNVLSWEADYQRRISESNQCAYRHAKGEEKLFSLLLDTRKGLCNLMAHVDPLSYNGNCVSQMIAEIDAFQFPTPEKE